MPPTSSLYACASSRSTSWLSCCRSRWPLLRSCTAACGPPGSSVLLDRGCSRGPAAGSERRAIGTGGSPAAGALPRRALRARGAEWLGPQLVRADGADAAAGSWCCGRPCASCSCLGGGLSTRGGATSAAGAAGWSWLGLLLLSDGIEAPSVAVGLSPPVLLPCTDQSWGSSKGSSSAGCHCVSLAALHLEQPVSLRSRDRPAGSSSTSTGTESSAATDSFSSDAHGGCGASSDGASSCSSTRAAAAQGHESCQVPTQRQCGPPHAGMQ
jgi:hypothetical protein